MSSASVSVAKNVWLKAIPLENVCNVDAVDHTGFVPEVIEFGSICELDPVGFVTPGFSIVIVNGADVGGMLSGLVTIKEVALDLTMFFAAVAVYPVPVKVTVQFVAKLRPVTVKVSSIEGTAEGETLVTTQPAVTSSESSIDT